MNQNTEMQPGQQGMYLTHRLDYAVDVFLNTITEPDARKQVLAGFHDKHQRMLTNSVIEYCTRALLEANHFMPKDALEFVRTQHIALISWHERMHYHSDLLARSGIEGYEKEFPGAFQPKEPTEPPAESEL